MVIRELTTKTLESLLNRLSPTQTDGSSVALNIRQLIAEEANAIDATMRDLSVEAWVVDSEIVISGIGGFVRYTIETGPGVKAGSVKAIKTDIEISVNRVRQRVLGGEFVSIEWGMGLSFDLPYPGERKFLDWNRISETKNLRPMQMIAGLDYTGYKPFTRSFAFEKGGTTHVFVAGGTGSGKSVAVCGLIASLCVGTSPSDLQVVVIDTKRCKDLAKVAGFPHVTMHHSKNDAEKALVSIEAEMRHRQKGGDDSSKIVVVIEEISDLVNLVGRGAITKILNGLSTTARSAGIHMIACTQYPNSKILDREFMVNFDVKLCGSFSSKQAMRQALDVEEFTGALLPKRGAFYVNHNGSVLRIQTPALFDDRLLAVVEQAQAKWRQVSPFRLPMVDVELAENESADDSDDDGAMISAITAMYSIDDIFDKDGSVRRGMRANLLELLFGDRTDANRNKRTLDRLLESMK